MPALDGILETALYVDDVSRAAAFYEDVLGLKRMVGDERFVAYSVSGKSVLLLFRRGGTLEPVVMPGGTIPPHDGHGPVHFAFRVPTTELPAWERHLTAHGVAIEGRTTWPGGGLSLYVRDPDGHLVEFATAGIWPDVA